MRVRFPKALRLSRAVARAPQRSAMCVLLAAAACSSSGMQSSSVGTTSSPTPASGVTPNAVSTSAGSAATGPAAAGTSAGAPGPVGSPAAAATASVAGASAGVASASAPGASASASGSAAAGSGGVSAAMGGMSLAGASVNAGTGAAAPLDPVDFDKLGPYAVMRDQPVGEGFEYPIASSDVGDGVAGCESFAGGFGGDASETATFITIPPDLKMNMYSLYRPAQLEEGKKYPIVTWGNGTCALPEGYGTLLKHIASHGIFVIAANSRQVGQNSVMTKALDWAFAANKDPDSPYYQRIDTDKVGAAGHSQGGAATITAASDSRIKTVIIFNGGASAPKSFLTISGDRDIPFTSLSGMKSAVSSAPKAAWLWYHMVPERGQFDGHLTLITQPERVVGPSAAWFKYIFDNDADAKAWLVGTSCKLCGMSDAFEYGENGL